MDKMKRTLRDLSLPGSLVLYIAIFVMLALVLSVMTNSMRKSTRFFQNSLF